MSNPVVVYSQSLMLPNHVLLARLCPSALTWWHEVVCPCRGIGVDVAIAHTGFHKVFFLSVHRKDRQLNTKKLSGAPFLWVVGGVVFPQTKITIYYHPKDPAVLKIIRRINSLPPY